MKAVWNRFAAALVLLSLTLPSFADGHGGDDWVAKSNEHAQVVLELLAKFSPEGAGRLGVDGLDEEIFDLGPNIYERSRADVKEILVELEKRLRDRRTESEEKIQRRLEVAQAEMAKMDRYQHHIINATGESKAAVEEICQILQHAE